MAEIIASHGWPGSTLVGEDGAKAAWLLVQHADHDVPLQERCLALLRDAVAEGEASSADLAYLTDRVCVNRGREQIYGTQFHGEGSEYRPRPIADPATLDERRAAVGLDPFAAYEMRLREMFGRDG